MARIKNCDTPKCPSCVYNDGKHKYGFKCLCPFRLKFAGSISSLYCGYYKKEDINEKQ